MNIQKLKLNDLNPAPYNPRKDLKPGDPEFEKLRRSIETFGFVEPLIVNRRTGNTVVGGHQRLKVLKALGHTEAECVIVDLATADEKALNVALNKVSGDWDDNKLEELLKGLTAAEYDITLTGFDAKELEKIFGEDVTVREDTPPRVIEETDTKLGDLFVLGEHRLLCGDSTRAEDVKRLTGGEKMDLLVTDPPYNVDYHGAAGTIENDAMEEKSFEEFLRAAFKSSRATLKQGAAWYIFYANAHGETVHRASRKELGEVREVLIWAKSSFVIGRQDYQWQHEPCVYGWTPGAGHYFTEARDESTIIDDFANINKMSATEAKRLLKEILQGDTPTTVIRENKPAASADHPTMKPVRLIARLIRNSSRPGEKVLDLFGGSGTTLIAAEQLNRRAFLVEYDPRYCDVIVRRWEKFTGRKAEKIEREGTK